MGAGVGAIAGLGGVLVVHCKGNQVRWKSRPQF